MSSVVENVNLPANITEIDSFLDSVFSEIPYVQRMRDWNSYMQELDNKGNLVLGFPALDLREALHCIFLTNSPNERGTLPFALFCYLINLFIIPRMQQRFRAKDLHHMFVLSSYKETFPDFLMSFKFKTVGKEKLFSAIFAPHLRDNLVNPETKRPMFFDPLIKNKIPYPRFEDLPLFLRKEIRYMESLPAQSRIIPAWRPRLMDSVGKPLLADGK